MPGYVGVNVTGNGFSVGNGGTNPGYFNSKGCQIADDLDMVRGDHQLSIGGNWIHSRIETLNNRPTNGAFTFNGQSTGLSLADFMLGIVSGGFLQGNPVYDYDHSDYVGAYAQDNWRVRPNLTVNLGLRWEPFLPVQNTYSWVSHFDQARFDQNVHSTVYPQAPAGPDVPGRRRLSGRRARRSARWRSSRRASAWSGRRTATSGRASAPRGASSTTRRICSSTRALRTTRRGARRSRFPNPPGGFADPYLGYPGGNPFPALNTGWATQPFPAFGVYVNTPLHLEPTSLQQWNVSVQRQIGDWLAVGELSRQPLEPSVARDRAQPGGLRPGRDDRQHQPAPRADPAEPRAGAVLRHDRPARRHRPRQLRRPAAVAAAPAEEQPQRAVELDDLEVHERSGDDRDHRADDRRIRPTRISDYSYCSSDRRHVVNLSVVARTPEFANRDAAGDPRRLAVVADRPLADRATARA